MTPKQTVRFLILLRNAQWEQVELADDLTGEQVDELYDALVERDEHWDAKSDVRCGEVKTGIPAEHSRHYESESVAAKDPNGKWVGWTYWFGGGKFGEPEAIEWIEDAYFLDCKEEEKVVTVRTFTKAEEEQ